MEIFCAAVIVIGTVLFSAKAIFLRKDVVPPGIGLFGTVVCLLANPAHSDYSPILLGAAHPISYEWLGFVGAYAVGLLAHIRSFLWQMVAAASLMSAFLIGHFPEGGIPEFTILPIATIAVMPAAWFTFIGTGLIAVFTLIGKDKLGWTPFGLIYTRSDTTAFDLSGYFLNLFSFPMAIFVGLGSILAVSSIGFANHVLVREFRRNHACRCLALLFGYLLCSSIAIPGMLSSALVVLFAFFLLLFYEAISSNLYIPPCLDAIGEEHS
jgi:hypothetical protein